MTQHITRPGAKPVTKGTSGPRTATTTGRAKNKRSRGEVFLGLSHVALVVWSLLVIIPLAWALVASFAASKNSHIFTDAWSLPGRLSVASWGRAWAKAHVGRYMLNTIGVVAVSTFGTMVLGSMAAYVLARYKFFGNRVIYFMFVSGMTFPVFLALVPLFFVVRNLGMLGTYQGIILVYIAYSLPFTVFFLSAFFRTLPTSVAEAAMIDGCGHFRTFYRIMMPMAKPGLISITIFNVIGQWNQYLLPIVLLPGDAEDKWVLTQGIAQISTNAGYEIDWPGLFAALSMAIIPVIVIYIVFQRQIQAGLTAGAVK
jgi:N-acetylglucosamine transport system permease protein